MWAILEYNFATFLKENLNSLRHVLLTQGIKLPRNLSAMLSCSSRFLVVAVIISAVELLLLLLLLVGNLRQFPELFEVAHSVRWKAPP